jgi:hypothetical protein
MNPMIVGVPEPFRSALSGGLPASVCDAEASTPEALYGRGVARIQVGRAKDARLDIEAALPALGDAARIEIAWRRSFRSARTSAETSLARPPHQRSGGAGRRRILGAPVGRQALGSAPGRPAQPKPAPGGRWTMNKSGQGF